LFFEVGDGTLPVDSDTKRVPFIVVANDQGLLGSPVEEISEILLGPAERYELLITFSGLNHGDNVTLRNAAPTLIGPGTFAMLW
jgi:FtsP/CotA-like multicopper oxidase with cupredoxin domain